ncbi:uncharacterized protein LOC111518786 [Drosophila willistoni]|uniref:uncharacterized protein LOC111518786 n=1 Tax=Drosophila willistoni TaxID=7260 RepID=UPI000C26DAC5|nr:uncharacterized protein LOC111518786 [Drosophila willistoni]
MLENEATKESISSRIELTNMKCLVSDKTFLGFEYCRIKSVNRTYKYFSLKVNFFKVPVENGLVNVVLYKRFNDYKPFLYNVTIDTCKFLASTKRNPFFSILYGLFSQQSNANHSCPYDHDIIVDKVTVDFLNHHVTRFMPIPSGDYAVFTNWYAYGIHRCEVRVYGTLS